MNVWRWLGLSIFLLGTVFLLSTSKFTTPQAFAQGDAKKVEVSADPDKATVKPGDSKAVAVKLKRGKDATKEVTLTAEVEPKDKGVTAKVDAKVAGDKSEAKLTVETTDKADGDYKITVKAKSDGSDTSATVALTVKKEETKKVDPPKVAAGAWKFEPFSKKGTVIYQKQHTKTTQKMKVMGQEVVQEQTQTFLIEWTALDPDKNNDFVVSQKIKGVDMKITIGGNTIAYDSRAGKQQKNPMTDFFEQLTKQDLKFTIKSDLSEVKSIEGRDAFIKGLSDINPQMQQLLKAILSEKALTKMAEPTWYAFPPKGDASVKTWSRKSELDLGPIGKYDTNFDFELKGSEGGNEKIGIKTKLTYTAPTEKAGLPFIIHEAKLSADGGTGTAIFNPTKGRFESTELSMKLTGNLVIEVGSMKTTVELTQDQTSRSDTYDTIPDDWKAK